VQVVVEIALLGGAFRMGGLSHVCIFLAVAGVVPLLFCGIEGIGF